MKTKVECPYCDGTAVLNSEAREIIHKQEPVSVNSRFYKCESCQEEFTTTETDTITMEQVMRAGETTM